MKALQMLLIINLFLGIGLAPAVAQYTPGGVGADLELWLKADEGVYTDTGCSSAASDGDSVQCWSD